ncbi:MAG: class I SAM-dependent methyltransferase [Calditrichaeota bacterium]|nr:class I SAM-dependent methyltransferase [Calditrichota bacterium]
MGKKNQPNSQHVAEKISALQFNLFAEQHLKRDHKDFVTFLIRELDIPYRAHALHIGCRSGQLSLELARRMPEIDLLAVDEDEEMVRVAQENQRSAGVGNVRFRHLTLHQLTDLKSDSFDAVISYQFLHCSEDPIFLLNQIWRTVKKKGKFAIQDYRSDLQLLGKIGIWFAATTMSNEIRKYWRGQFRSSYSLREIVAVLLKTEMKDWKIRTTLLDFLVYYGMKEE